MSNVFKTRAFDPYGALNEFKKTSEAQANQKDTQIDLDKGPKVSFEEILANVIDKAIEGEQEKKNKMGDQKTFLGSVVSPQTKINIAGFDTDGGSNDWGPLV